MPPEPGSPHDWLRHAESDLHFVRQSAITTEYAVEARYPSDMEEITEKEYLDAVRLARQVLSWATDILDSVK